jgi:hypothetical protein
MQPRLPGRSLPRAIAVVSVIVALALASFGCGTSIDRGKVLFSTDVPSASGGCSPSNQVTSVSATTSVYATYVFKARPGSETITLHVTKDGTDLFPPTDLSTADTNGKDCISDTADLSQLANWGAGTVNFSLTSGGSEVASGDLTVK